MKLIKVVFITVIVFLGFFSLNAQESYNYLYNGEAVSSPLFYSVEKVVENRNYFGIPLDSPEDIFIDEKGDIYIADTGNNRVLKLNSKLEASGEFKEFLMKGEHDRLAGPEGIFVSRTGAVHVADTANQRIVVFDKNGNCIEVIGEPESDIIREEYKYLPSKIVQDKAGRTYAVGPGMYEGIMEFDQQGAFSGFLGSNRVEFNLADVIWRKISSKEQQSAQIQFIPEEFSNIDIDAEGFIYSVTKNEDSENPIKRHNAEGLDVLRDGGPFPPSGDINPNNAGTVTGNSVFCDISVEDDGVYHCLDKKRGRIFSYSPDGDILSIFGNLGDRYYTFRNPVALDVSGHKIFVLDKELNRFTVLNPTVYGHKVKEALSSHNSGNYDLAGDLWLEVLERNTNLELAYSGLGKIALREKDYTEAADMFLLAGNRKEYSKAFRHLRRLRLKEKFSLIMGLILFIPAFLFVRYYFFGRKKNKPRFSDYTVSTFKRIKFVSYMLKKPVDGMWELKFSNVGTLTSANIILFIYILVFLLKAQFTGFLFQSDSIMRFNLIKEIFGLVAPLILFTIANWSLTSLMDGSGSVKDIYISVLYALSPVVLSMPVLILLSRFLVMEEASFYYVLEAAAWGWFLLLLFIGNMTVHEYSPLKTISMLLLTVVSAGIILFLLMLFFTFIQQVWTFVYSIIKELVYRG